MKTKLIVLAGLAVLGMAAYMGTRLWAQQPGAGPAVAPASPKIGLINLAYVLKNYNKFSTYNAEIEKIRIEYQKKEDDFKKLVKDWQTFGSRPEAKQAEREQAEDSMKKLKRSIEDNSAEYTKVRSKKSDEQMVQMYLEIEAATKTFANSNGFHMVLHYSEPLNEADKKNAQNIQRKLIGPGQSGGVCPIYFVDGMDVSEQVVRTLNTMFPAPAGAAANGPAAAQPKQ